MSNEVQKPIAGGSDSPVETGNITMAELASRRISQKAQKAAPKGEAEKSPEAVASVSNETKESTKEPEKEGGEKVGSEEKKDEGVLSKEIDLENLTEGELQELAEKLGSRAVARFGELTAKRKQAEERAQALEAQLHTRANQDPLSDDKPKENPYSSLKTLEDLKAKTKEVDGVIEWAEDVLWNNDHRAADDVVAEVEGKEVTKAQVRKALRDAQKARKEHLPDQLRELEQAAERKAVKSKLEASMRQELPWLTGEDNDTRRQYENMMKDPAVEKAIKAVPELEATLPYVVAHAANSFYGRKPIEMGTKPAPQIKPPSNPSSGAAQAEQPEGRTQKAEKEKRQQLAETGSVQDFVALRTHQISQRKKVS